ncbi:MAG: hypothetical protein LUQ16_03805 [Methanomassiliicoccales archaeon]|nr:hypothetical protein [Methanomassiliicoccales archaeon]
MEKIGVCMTCGKPAISSCRMCGRLVCPQHYYSRAGLCSHCIPPTERRNSEHGRDEPPPMVI